MFIAHLPAGYLVGSMVRRFRPLARSIMPAALIGSITPDVDMFYFYLIDSGRTHHHQYVTHWPLFWALLGVVVLSPLWARRSQWLPAGAAFFLGVLSHMVLDTVVSPIFWLAPFSQVETELFSVPPTHEHWIVSFVLHWTFLLELAICLMALLVFVSLRYADANTPRS